MIPTNDLKSSIPEGEAGDWAVKRFTVAETDASFSTLRAIFHNGRGAVAPGEYTKLTYRRAIVMSDTLDEIRDQREAIYHATGNVLVTGLGLGLTVEGMLQRKCVMGSYHVEHLTVLEIAPEVIQLVAPTLQAKYGERLEIIQADAFTWEPGERHFDYIWHDIWRNISSDNLPEMQRLKRKYRSRLTLDTNRYRAKQDCWLEDECKRLKRRGY